MIKVGFTIIGGKTSWMGGINYLKNLLYAISKLEDKKIHPVLFVGKKIDPKLLSEFEGLAEIKQYSVFDRLSVSWFLDTLLRDIFQLNPLMNSIIIKNEIEVFSHSYIYGRDLKCKTINWIPDFQHVHLPKMFSFLNFHVRNYRLKLMSKYSDLIMLSSFDADKDLKKFTPKYSHKGRVVHFVSQVDNFDLKSKNYLESKYNFSGKFFFLPNQFWAHKNHKVVFEAVNILRKKNIEVLLVCTGEMNDNRNDIYMQNIKSFIINNELSKYVLLLGKLPFSEVLSLMYHSHAVINPSYFEGWSSSVEEAKGMNKDIILSNIGVHIEQAKDIGTFFNPNNAEELANILINKISFEGKQYRMLDVKTRTLEFAKQYVRLFDELNILI